MDMALAWTALDMTAMNKTKTFTLVLEMMGAMGLMTTAMVVRMKALKASAVVSAHVYPPRAVMTVGLFDASQVNQQKMTIDAMGSMTTATVGRMKSIRLKNVVSVSVLRRVAAKVALRCCANQGWLKPMT